VKALRRFWKQLTAQPQPIQTPRSVLNRLHRYHYERQTRLAVYAAKWDRQWEEQREKEARERRTTYTVAVR
jgi:hypothetical protein